jgi:hypothetical protein
MRWDCRKPRIGVMSGDLSSTLERPIADGQAARAGTVRRGRAGWVIAAAAVVGIMAAVWFVWARPNLVPRNFGVVEEGRVYRSAALTPGALRVVRERFGIKTIVDLGAFDKDPLGERVEGRAAAALGMERFVFPLEGDGTGNPNAYVAALRIMTDPARLPVLVHCSTGAQRTGGCVMLYRDLAQGRALDETYDEAKRYRHDPGRNPRLLPFLREHEAAIMGAVRGGGSIPGYPGLDLTPCPPQPAKP